MDSTNPELSIYEVAQLKGTQVATVKNAIKNKKLRVNRELPVGKTRTLAMILRTDAERWSPRESGASVRKAAKLLGLDEDVAEELRARYMSSGKQNQIEIIEA